MVKSGRRRFQFRLRRLVIWTVVAALVCGILLAGLEPEGLDWIVLPVWFVTVFIVRWGFGSKKWAARISIVLGMLVSLGWAIYRPKPPSVVELVIGCGIMGGSIGYVSFLLVEAAREIVNRIDKIGQSDG